MKRAISIILALLIIILSIPLTALGEALQKPAYIKRNTKVAIKNEEADAMQAALKARELYGAGFSIEPLYDANDEPTFLLGMTELGFAIMERKSGTVFECGEVNPYYGFEPYKKYYGGALCWYVKEAARTAVSDSERYLNIMTGRHEPLPEPFIAEAVRSPGETVYVQSRLKNERYITQYAFGYNVNGTCNRIGFAIALNYLRMQHQSPVCTTSTTPELFVVPDNGKFPEKENVPQLFPQAEALHQTLNGYFGPPILAWGNTYCKYANNYLKDRISNSANRPVVYCKLKPDYSYIANEIKANRPIVVSTWNAPVYGYHTMAVYGCRETITEIGVTPLGIIETRSDYELLVHCGWYEESRFRKIGGVKFEQKDHYVNTKVIPTAISLSFHNCVMPFESVLKNLFSANLCSPVFFCKNQ